MVHAFVGGLIGVGIWFLFNILFGEWLEFWGKLEPKLKSIFTKRRIQVFMIFCWITLIGGGILLNIHH